MGLIHCIYASSGTALFHEYEIPTLLERARAKNEKLGITGMLLFIEGSFFQVLEGDQNRVDEVYTTISRDPRHDRVTQVIREPIARRSFDDWSMGYASMAREELSQLVGTNDFFANASCLEQIDAGRAKKLLTAFRSGRWRTERTGVHRAHARIA